MALARLRLARFGSAVAKIDLLFLIQHGSGTLYDFLSPLGADMVCKSGNSFADALFTQGLMAFMQPIICCVRAQSAREFVTEFSGGATPH